MHAGTLLPLQLSCSPLPTPQGRVMRELQEMEEEAARLGTGIDEGTANKRQLVAGEYCECWVQKLNEAAAPQYQSSAPVLKVATHSATKACMDVCQHASVQARARAHACVRACARMRTHIHTRTYSSLLPKTTNIHKLFFCAYFRSGGGGASDHAVGAQDPAGEGDAGGGGGELRLWRRGLKTTNSHQTPQHPRSCSVLVRVIMNQAVPSASTAC